MPYLVCCCKFVKAFCGALLCISLCGPSYLAFVFILLNLLGFEVLGG